MLNSDHFLITADILSHSNSTRSIGTGSYPLNALNYRKANLPALADHLTDSHLLYDSFSSHSLEIKAPGLHSEMPLPPQYVNPCTHRGYGSLNPEQPVFRAKD